jgi:hypothetical protein
VSLVESRSLGEPAVPSQQSLLALSWLNFFLSGMQTAFGPIAAAYLAIEGWTAKDIGFALTIGGTASLLAFVDDATSRLLQLRFVTSESAFDYFRTMRAYLEEHGKPVAFYSDKHGIFRVNSKDAAGGDGVTRFGRALLALNIDIICANSPQAKGRIALRQAQERVWHVAGPDGQEPAPAKAGELRLAGVSSMAAANAWLPGFITAYNTRFGRDPANAKSLPLA